MQDRFCRLLGQAEDLFSPDEDAAVEQGFRPLTEGRVLEGPYGRWLGHLMEGRCRLPELNPEAMKALLLAWLSSEVEGSWVCRGCGLEYPHRKAPLSQWRLLPGKVPLVGSPPWYDLPAFFRACPHCGASDFDVEWAHPVTGGGRAWQELDGYVGVPAGPA